MPGDVINTEVYVKYVDSNQANWQQAMTDIISAISNNTGGIVLEGGSIASSTSSFPHPGTLGSSGTNGTAPKVYLNWIVFDTDYVVQPQSGFTRISEAARETGTDIAHERLYNPTPITITKPGFVYIYFSNENDSQVEAFFDDFQVQITKSPIIRKDDYYPFGLTFNSHSRDNADQDFLYNGKELQDELNLGWLDYGARMYMNDIGRWGVVDPLAEKMAEWSVYNYAFNDPVKFVDPDGMEAVEGQAVYSNGFFSFTDRNATFSFEHYGSFDIASNNPKSKGPEKPLYSLNSRTQARREQMAQDVEDNKPGFWLGARDGAVAGGVSTVDFVKSLGTVEGWKNVGRGLVTLAELGHPIPNATQVQFQMGVTQYVQNIPNMTAYEIGYDLGYGTEKLAETVLLSKGAGAAGRFLNFGARGGYGVPMNLGKLGKFEFMYRNPSVKGGTIFSYQSVNGGKFRIDFHSFNSRGRTLHFHSNYGSYKLSPHRSLNPFRFGQPIK